MSHKLIARMPGEYRENHAIFPEMLANAHLIAAAPAMYEALGELIAYLRNNVADEALDNWAPVLKAAYALAQAEGSKP